MKIKTAIFSLLFPFLLNAQVPIEGSQFLLADGVASYDSLAEQMLSAIERVLSDLRAANPNNGFEIALSEPVDIIQKVQWPENTLVEINGFYNIPVDTLVGIVSVSAITIKTVAGKEVRSGLFYSKRARKQYRKFKGGQAQPGFVEDPITDLRQPKTGKKHKNDFERRKRKRKKI